MEKLTLTQYTEEELSIIVYAVVKEALKPIEEALENISKPDELLTRQEVAAMVGVTLTTLWHWDKKDMLKPVRIGSKVRYKRSDIEKAMRS